MSDNLERVADMLPRLREHLPRDLYAELCAAVYIVHGRPLTDADIQHGQQIARRLGLDVEV